MRAASLAPPWCVTQPPPCGPDLASDRLRLADGRQVLLRPVRPADAAAEGELIRDLSPATRRLRFHGAVNALPAAALRALTHVDPCRASALVAQPLPGRGLVADARYVIGDTGQAAEFAIAVADAWQGQGLGRALMRRLADHASARGLRRLHGEVLDHNHGMLALMQSLGAELTQERGALGLVRVEMMLAA